MPHLGDLMIWSLLVFILNLPFGYWRDNVRKFSNQWIFAIHLPVPAVILIRMLTHAGWHWSTYVFFMATFFMGQFIGGLLHRKHEVHCPQNTTSCLIMDLYRRC